MERFLPHPAVGIELDEVYGEIPLGDGRPWVRLTMIASVDGATAVDGLSGGLGCPADQHLFLLNRAFADAVFVGAGTVRAEGYGPAPIPADLQDARRRRGQEPVPPIAVVSRSCAFDWEAPFFTEAVARPIVVTVSSAPEERLARAAEVAHLVLAGDDDVDPGAALEAMRDLGIRRLAAEGGPTLNAHLADAGLIDELCVTISPHLVAGHSKRLLAGAALGEPERVTLVSACREGDFLFLCYRRSGGP